MLEQMYITFPAKIKALRRRHRDRPQPALVHSRSPVNVFVNLQSPGYW
jgi:hypothetical protein